MTVPSPNFRNDYLGNGATSVYNFTFRVFEESELLVVTADTTGAETTLALTTDYTVTGEGDINGGTITLVAGNLTSGWALTITRNMPLTQETDLRNRSTIFAEVLEDQYDRDVMVEQQLQNQINRAIKIPETETGLAGTVIPSATVRANKVFVWDASGIPAAGDTVSAFAGAITVVQVVDTIAALKAIPAPLTALTYLVRGYAIIGDGGDGLFRFNTSDLTADNGGTVIAPDVGTGRWNRLIEGEQVNVRWFGAKGDAATDDTVAITAAVAASLSSSVGSVYFPPGSYRLNLDLAYRVNLVGSGNQRCILSSFTAAGYAITLNDRGVGWLFSTISDMQVGRGAASEGGVRFGGDSYVANDEFTGRWIFDHVNFACNVGVYKQTGNIGNRFISCQFQGGTYGVYAYKRAGGTIMHSGADTFLSCHFQECSKAAYFANSAIDGSSNLSFKDCIFEANVGFAIFIYNWTSTFSPGVWLDNIFQENNATGGTIAVHVGATGLAGATTNFTARNFFFRNVHQCLIESSAITTWQLENSVISVRGTATGDNGAGVVKDSASALLVDAVTTDLTTSLDFFAENIIAATRQPNGGAGCSVFLTKPRIKATRRYAANLIRSVTFDESTPQTLDTVPFTRVADGTVFETCAAATAPDALRHTFFTDNLTTNKYFVLTVDLALQSGTITEFGIYGTSVVAANLGSANGAALTAGRWYTMAAIGDTIGFAAPSISWQLTMSNGAVCRFGGYQLLVFDTLQEAAEFQRSGEFQMPATRAREFYSAAVPTTGTFIVGDRVWFTVPAAGATPGAICTAAGTPGTWRNMANLA